MAAQREQVLMESQAQWRAWLTEHASSSPGVWLVTWRRTSGRPVLGYEELVEEALCFGWVDGQARAVDAERTSLLLTPPKRGSGWARSRSRVPPGTPSRPRPARRC